MLTSPEQPDPIPDPATGQVQASGPGTVVLLVPEAGVWRATVGGARLEPTTALGWAQGFKLPAGASRQPRGPAHRPGPAPDPAAGRGAAGPGHGGHHGPARPGWPRRSPRAPASTTPPPAATSAWPAWPGEVWPGERPAAPAGGPGGPEEDRPAPLIPSRAARHQKKGNRLFRGRGAQPPPPPQSPPTAAPPRPAAARRPAGSRPGGPPPRPGREPRPAGGRPAPPRPPPPLRTDPTVRPCPDGGTPASRGAPDARRRRAEGAAGPQGPPAARPQARRPARLQPRPGRGPGRRGGRAGRRGQRPAAARPPATPVTRDPYSARWVCPLLPGQTTAVTIANVGDADRLAAHHHPRERQEGRPDHQGAGRRQDRAADAEAGQAGFVQVEAFSAPVVVSAPGLGCAPGPGNRWWLPASDTRFGTETKVIIANPDSQPATGRPGAPPDLRLDPVRRGREVFIQPGEAVVRPSATTPRPGSSRRSRWSPGPGGWWPARP